MAGTVRAPWTTSALGSKHLDLLSSLPEVHVPVPRPPLREREVRLAESERTEGRAGGDHGSSTDSSTPLFAERTTPAQRAARGGIPAQDLCLRLRRFSLGQSVGPPARSPAVPGALAAVWGPQGHRCVLGKSVDVQ